MALGARIRYYREKAKLTLEQLSERSGVDVGTISALENRDSSRSKFATAVAQGLGMSLEMLEDESQDLDVVALMAAPEPPRPSASPVGMPSSPRDRPLEGYVRLEHLSPSPSMGHGAYLDEPVHVVRHLDVLEQWVRQKVGSTNPERIKVLTGHGQSMMPTIQDQDLVFVDIGQRSIETAGIYVIDVAGRLLLKKALILSDGTLILRSDNVVDYPDEERHNLAQVAETICVAGRVLAWWTLRQG